MITVGIDVGGTKIAGALVSETGDILKSLKVPTPADNTDDLITAVVEMVKKLSSGQEVAAVGVAIAGFIDADQSEVIYSPNLSLRNEPLKAKLEARLGIDVFVENDANAAGWAEYRFGAGKDSDHMMMITIGTGVGGAIVAKGELFRGGFGIGAELGHTNFIQEGRPCGCGQNGCLEQYASGSALLDSAKELAASGTLEGARLAELQSEVGELSGTEVYKAITESDMEFCNSRAQSILIGFCIDIAINALATLQDLAEPRPPYRILYLFGSNRNPSFSGKSSSISIRTL